MLYLSYGEGVNRSLVFEVFTFEICAEPFNKTMVAMNRTMDEIEAILDKKGM